MSTPTSPNQSTGPFQPRCAACTHQRRRCSADCPYAPYFPAGMCTRDFENVYRLYRLNRLNYILTSLQDVPQDACHRAMKGIVTEAKCRAAYPVHGICTFFNNLQQKIDNCQAELDLFRAFSQISTKTSPLLDQNHFFKKRARSDRAAVLEL